MPPLYEIAIKGQSLASGAGEEITARPNVILIVTDDQGYGNMSCHGKGRSVKADIALHVLRDGRGDFSQVVKSIN
ncbi:MAG: hypothetical protein R3C18_24585 [Planctomycetaceae bacterium]